MLPSFDQERPQLFRFTVPGLPDIALAVPLQAALTVVDLPSVTPVPLAQPFVLGVSEWQRRTIAILDVAALICGHISDQCNHGIGWRFLIMQMVVDAQSDAVACPILAGAGVVAAPSQVPLVDVPAPLSPAWVHATIALADETLTLLNLEGLGQCEAIRSRTVERC